MNTKIKSTTFTVFADPGHAWLRVPRPLLVEFGILNKISAYSYQKGNAVYLEEDGDATHFVEAFQERFGSRPLMRTSHTNNSSWIRKLASFDPSVIPLKRKDAVPGTKVLIDSRPYIIIGTIGAQFVVESEFGQKYRAPLSALQAVP